MSTLNQKLKKFLILLCSLDIFEFYMCLVVKTSNRNVCILKAFLLISSKYCVKIKIVILIILEKGWYKDEIFGY